MNQKQSDVSAKARILRRADVQARTGLSRSSIYRGIQEGSFPRAVNLGPRMVGWIEDEIQTWIDDRVRQRGVENPMSQVTKPRPK